MWCYCVIILNLITLINCYNILGLFPHPGKSHFDAFEPLLKKLANKGHNVTVISYFPQKVPIVRYKDINLRGTEDPFVECFNFYDFSYTRLRMYYEALYLAAIGRDSCTNAFKSKELLDFLDNDEGHYDLIIHEFFNSDCLLGFVHKYKAPLIGIGSNTIMSWMNMRFGNVDHPAYVTNNFLKHTDNMSFMERVENTIINLFCKFVYYYLIDKPTYEIVKPYFVDDDGNDNMPALSDIAMNSSLLLTNSHFSLFSPRPLVPSVIEVSGLHIDEPKPIPKVM